VGSEALLVQSSGCESFIKSASLLHPTDQGLSVGTPVRDVASWRVNVVWPDPLVCSGELAVLSAISVVIQTEIKLRLHCAPGRGNCLQNGRVEFSEWNEGLRRGWRRRGIDLCGWAA
jgi:hypothetical protein